MHLLTTTQTDKQTDSNILSMPTSLSRVGRTFESVCLSVCLSICPEHNSTKKDGYHKRNVRQFLQSASGIFWPPWVRPLDNRGTCYIWMKRRFNTCQKHRSMYPSIFNRLRAIARYWSNGRKLQRFPTTLHLTPPLGCSHWNSGKKFGPQKTRIMGLPGSEDSLTIG